LPEPTKQDGQLAAKVFERLARGISFLEIVTELKEHPDIVEGLRVQGAALER
jgi:hypothetical protein